MRREKPALVFLNPDASAGRSRTLFPRLEAFFRTQDFPAEFVRAETPQELEERARQEIAAGRKRLVAVGGDGTFQWLVNAALGADVVLGLVPAGGGNDVAAALGLPSDPIAAAHAVVHGQPRAIDVLRARAADGRERCYVGGGGLGLDAAAADHARRQFRRWPGSSRYIAAALWALRKFRPLGIEAEICGSETNRASGRVLLAAVTNTPAYGAGVKIEPEARLDDGQLNLVLVGTLPFLRILEVIPRILQTGRLDWPEIRRFRGRRVRLRADRPAQFHGDGEVLGPAPVEIEVLPAAVRVLAPRRGNAG